MPQAPSSVARRKSRVRVPPPKGDRAKTVLAKALEAPSRRILWALVFTGLAAFVVFAVLAYALNWQWTGFPGNTLWDWLQLLLVPLALNAATIWYSGGGRMPLSERRMIRLGLGAGMAIVVVVVIAAAYRFRWAWTGFLGQPSPAPASPQPKTLWDWLNMLLLPAAVAIATIQFSRRRQARAAEKSAA